MNDIKNEKVEKLSIHGIQKEVILRKVFLRGRTLIEETRKHWETKINIKVSL